VEKRSIVWNNLIAQEHVKELLGSAYSSGSLGHAYLFCGDEGVGKFAAALDLAMFLLCTSEGSAPCQTCSSCKKVINNNHPDLHIVMPLPFEKDHKVKPENSKEILTQKGWDFISSNTFRKIHAPYLPLSFSKEDSDEKDDSGKKTSFKVPAIPVAWIRELRHQVLRGSIAGECSVIIFFDIDIMEAPSANAMLKMLEEPPANTYMILTTSKPETLLPTIASRCQIVRFGHIPSKQIEEQLNLALGQAGDGDLVKRAVYYSMGSLGRALAIIKTEESANGLKTLQETARDVKDLWELCFKGDWLVIASAVDAMAKERNYTVHEQFFTSMLYLIRNSFLQKNGCSENYIDASDVLHDPAGVFARQESSEQLTRACNDAISSVKAYGNIAIILVNFVMTVMEIIHGEKQQAG
jgi:DNA polymerase III delta prime subunit